MSDFQHRHYARVAALLSDLRDGNITAEDLTDRFADMFARDNERFSRRRFMLAATGKPFGKDADTADVNRVAGMPYR